VALLNLKLYVAVLVTITASLANALSATASANEARITQVNNSVQLLHPARGLRQASVNEVVDEQTIVRTGKDSHAELTFSNGTIVRLAANSAFNFRDGMHDLNLGEGATLIQAPKNATRVMIHAGNVAAVITGTTCMIECHPGSFKFLVLEGSGRLYRPGHLGDSVLVGPGQLVIGKPNAALSDPVDFDVARFVRTSRFTVGLPPLASEKLITAECQKQQREKSKKTLVDTNLVIFGGGTRVSVVGQAQANGVGASTVTPATSHSTQQATGAPH
jgi:FecR-like protein